MALIAIGVLLIAGVLASAHPGPADPELSGFKIQPGDTLWTLAATHPVEGLTTAEVADLIADANQLENPVLSPGATILVPVRPVEARLAFR